MVNERRVTMDGRRLGMRNVNGRRKRVLFIPPTNDGIFPSSYRLLHFMERVSVFFQFFV